MVNPLTFIQTQPLKPARANDWWEYYTRLMFLHVFQSFYLRFTDVFMTNCILIVFDNDY